MLTLPAVVPPAVLSWPGLVDTYLNYMNKEVTEHKKQLDATAIKVFKTIFTAADNADRCGKPRVHPDGTACAHLTAAPICQRLHHYQPPATSRQQQRLAGLA
jgi:hypothetical protein